MVEKEEASGGGRHGWLAPMAGRGGEEEGRELGKRTRMLAGHGLYFKEWLLEVGRTK